MKILIIRPFPERINIDNYNVQEIGLARALIQRGHECGVVFFESGKENSEQLVRVADNQNIHIYWRKGINILKNGLFFGLDKIIQEYDVIQVHEYDQLFSWYMYSFYKKPVVVYHGPYYNAFNKRYNLKTAIFDKLFLNNKNTKKAMIITKSELASTYIRSKGFAKVKTIGVGLDKTKLIDEKASEKVENIRALIEGKNSFLYVGKIEERRNILFLLDVFAEVNKRHYSKLVLIGDGTDEYTQKVVDKIIELDIKDTVIWEKKLSQSQLSHLYSSCKYFLFTTEYDIFGMVLLEAMYYGMIVFSSMNGGSSTLIDSSINGFLIDKFDKDIWAKCINEVINCENSDIRINARETIQSNYLWTSLVDEFISVYNECFENYYKG